MSKSKTVKAYYDDKEQRKVQWREDWGRHMRAIEQLDSPADRWSYICDEVPLRMTKAILKHCEDKEIVIERFKPKKQIPVWDGPEKGNETNSENN